MTPIAEVRIPIMLDRERTSIWNANTMVAFEDATDKFYWDCILKLQEFYRAEGAEMIALGDYKEGEAAAVSRKRLQLWTRVTKYISTKDLRALVWASVHEYDPKHPSAEPKWPLTVSQVGRYLLPQNSLAMIANILRGHNGNSPTKEELGEASGGASAKKPETTAEKETTEDGDSGAPGSVLPDDVFTSA